MTDYKKEAERLPELHREIVDDALEVVDTFGPWGMDINEDLRRQIVLADEVRQLRKLYSAAVKGRQEMRSALRDARAALLAHIQRGAVPEGWQLVPINHTPEMRAAWDGAPDSEDDDMAFHFGYRAMLAAAPDHFRDAAKMTPAPADVPMPEPDGFKVTTPDGLTYFRSVPATLPHHTVYPLIAMAQALTYGAACEAAGYARGLKEAGRDAERYRWLRSRANADSAERLLAMSWESELDGAIDAALRGEVKP